MEASYNASLFKKKSVANSTSQEALSEFHAKSRVTLECLTRNMIDADVSLDKVFEFYHEIKRENIVKLLYRCKNMYEARSHVKKILLLVIRKEELTWYGHKDKI